MTIKPNKEGVALDCQVGVGLPPLVSGITRGEIELRTSKLTIFNRKPANEGNSKNTSIKNSNNNLNGRSQNQRKKSE